MSAKIIIGVMGPGDGASPENCTMAYQLGKRIAEEGWVTLSGGRNVGVMDAVSRGAKAAGGLTLGILPGNHPQQTSDFIDIPVLTGMGSARNNINVLTSQVVVCCGMGAGTLSEVALAIKAKKHVLFLNVAPNIFKFFCELAPKGTCHRVASEEEAIEKIRQLLELK